MPDPSVNFAPTFEQIVCDNCGSSDAKFLFSGPDRLHGFPGQFSLVQCTRCGWIRQNPRPILSDLDRYYPEDYVPYAKATEDEKGFWNRWDRRYGALKRCRSIERIMRTGRLLEVGCGTGIFLNEMRRRNWSVVGIEPNAYASDYAKTRFDMEIFKGTLAEYDPPPESFDVICAWNVVEHLPTPAQDMLRMQRALKKGGLLVMSIPSLESLDRRLFGESWLGWELPRHLYFFSRKQLEDFVSRHNMRIVGAECPAGSYHAFLLSVQFYLRDRAPHRKHLVDVAVEMARQFPMRAATIPFFWLLDALRMSSLLTYYVRKDG